MQDNVSKKYVVFMCHAKSLRIGEFPDITNEGKHETIAAVRHGIAPFVLSRVENGSDMMFIASPEPRAFGTADLVRGTLGLGCTLLHTDARFYLPDGCDPVRAKAVLQSFACELLASPYKLAVVVSHHRVLLHLTHDCFHVESVKNSEPIYAVIEQAPGASIGMTCIFRGERYKFVI